MRRARHTLALAALAATLLAPGTAYGMEERFPPPDFGPEYEYPQVQEPPPRRRFRTFLDVAALVAALSLASYLALVRRSRRLIQALMILSLAYFGFWRKGCVCPIGAIQNVTLGLFDPGYAVPAVATVFFILPLVYTLFFGRTFCGAVCPLGAVQDVVAVKPLAVPDWLERALGMMRYVYLALALLLAANGAMFVVCQYDPFVAFFRLTGTASMLVLGASFLVIGVYVARPYCRYVCPYGAILGWCSRVSRWRVTIYPEECVKCRLCEESCPFGAIRRPTEDLGAAERTEGKTRLGATLAAAPAFVAVAALAGWLLAGPLSRTHATVRLADRVALEDAGHVADTTDASDAFRKTERAVAELCAEAAGIERGFAVGGLVVGGLLGIVFWAELVGLSVRRGRTDYEADRARCVSCGRCFGFCPNERARREGRDKDPPPRHGDRGVMEPGRTE